MVICLFWNLQNKWITVDLEILTYFPRYHPPSRQCFSTGMITSLKDCFVNMSVTLAFAPLFLSMLLSIFFLGDRFMYRMGLLSWNESKEVDRNHVHWNLVFLDVYYKFPLYIISVLQKKILIWKICVIIILTK